MGGFGSAVSEAANDAGLDTSHIRRLGIPDQYVEHADRSEQLASLNLSEPGNCRNLPQVGRPGACPRAVKELMKSYVGLRGTSSAQDKLFACPADVYYYPYFVSERPNTATCVEEELVRPIQQRLFELRV